jgi:hypothetical protein
MLAKGVAITTTSGTGAPSLSVTIMDSIPSAAADGDAGSSSAKAVAFNSDVPNCGGIALSRSVA